MFTNIIGGKLEVKLMDRCINSGEKSQRREEKESEDKGSEKGYQ